MEITATDLIEIKEGWYWPKDDIRTWKFLLENFDLPSKISKYVDNKQVIVQAGGNCGIYPKQYSRIFDTVYTFEPDWLNFYCLAMNCSEENIIKSQGCLGAEPGLVNLHIKAHSRGKSFINGDGRYPIYLIDNLGLTTCDLIHLDIEGYEYFALKGAISTIKKFKPVIAIEMWDPPPSKYLNRFGGNINQKTKDLLASLGYTHVDTLNESDWIYICKQE